MIFKFAFREIYRNWNINLFFVLNLSLGLIGFLTVDSFKTTLQKYISENSKRILSADLAVSARREITKDELQNVRNIIGNDVSESQIFDFFAMISTPSGSKLVLVKAIDQSYPFYGEIELESGPVISEKTPNKTIFTAPKAWVYPELKYQLNLKRGEKFRLGNIEFILDDFVIKDSSQTFRLTSLAPRVFIDRSLLNKTGLIKYGSTFTQSYLFKIKDDKNISEKISQIYSLNKDPAFRIETPASAGEDSSRQLDYLSDFLSLVALVALVLSALGTAYLYRLYLSQHIKEIAIYRSLGLQQDSLFKIYFCQIFLLGILSLIPTVIGVNLLLPVLSQFIEQLTSLNLNPLVSGKSVLITYVLAFISSCLITLPYLLKLNQLKPARLFSEETFSPELKIDNPLVFVPALVVLYFLSVWQSHSLYFGSIFFGALVGLSLIISLISFGFLQSLSKIPKKMAWYFRIALKSLSRRKNQSWAVFLAIAIGSLLINLLPQMKTSLKNDFAVENQTKLPSIFLFDIQDDQIEDLKNELIKNNIPLLNVSPLVRSRLLKVNDQNYERAIEPQNFKTREEESAARSRNRGVNLSYREVLTDTEKIISGVSIDKKYDPNSSELPLASLEKRFAERMNLKLGDVLSFDIQGVEIKAKVASVRQVRWNSFRPNFFILLQDGVLNEAPKTFIAVLPQLDENIKSLVLSNLNRQFPNVSALDVRRTVEEVLQVSEKMSWSLELMAALALATGYVVLFSIIQTQVQTRRWELNMYKILGAHFFELRWVLIFEFTLISFVASLCGAFLSLFLSAILMYEMFGIQLTITWLPILSTVIFISVTSALIAIWCSRQVVREKPLVLLQGS
ncbi:MAG: FtsX-like permease family protein [Bdellovibrionota bacterium]